MTNNRNFLNTSHQSLAWFLEQSDEGRLDLRPGFQRRPVWTNEEKAFLIDSVLRGYPIPEIYIQTIDNGSRRTVAVVDGQQRLRACLEYMSDGFPAAFDVHKLAPIHSLEDTPWYAKRFSQLSETERGQIRKYKLIVRDLEDAPEDAVRHLFHRLNQSNVALNSQELRYSIYKGGLLEIAEELVKHPAWDHIRMFTKQQQRRMLDSEYISELIIGHMHFPQNKKDDLDEYYRRYAVELPGSRNIREIFDVSLNALVAAFPYPHMDRTRWYRKSDFYTLLLAITRGNIPLIDGSAKSVKESLVEFSDLVSGPPREGEPSAVTTYREAVERAATDRGRRVRREDALVAFIEGRELVPRGDRPDDEVDEEVDDESALEYEDVPLEGA